MGNSRKIILAVAALILLAGGWFYHYRQEQAAAQSARELKLSGNVDLREVSLAFRGSDRLEELFAEEGDAVKKGQILARLETKELLLTIARTRADIQAQESVVELLHNGTRPEEIHRAEEALNAARAKSEFAEGVMVRRQQIYDEVEGVSVQELDNAISQAAAAAAETAAAEQAYAEAVAGPRVEEIAQAEAKLESLRQELARQEYLLKETELVAPSDGVIRSRLLEVGDMASPQLAVFKLSLNDKKWVRAYIRETDLGKVHEGQKATVIIDSFPKDPIEGQVGYISGTAEFTPKTVQTDELRTSLLYEIRVYVSDSDNRLRLGMPATVRVAL
ncbi:MAG: efflux RND transporter periplasmic adaptor subunit [Schwartzia sp.]|nr:efflux RND transporter periplasmic adaptor subunit [Schwartzia sp. (in: firmicutes)]